MVSECTHIEQDCIEKLESLPGWRWRQLEGALACKVSPYVSPHAAYNALRNKDTSHITRYVRRTLLNALRNKDTLHMEHYIIRTLCI